MEWQKNELEINPVDKLEEILGVLQDYNFEVHRGGEDNEEYRNKLNAQGGKVEYRFWNPADDLTIEIPQK